MKCNIVQHNLLRHRSKYFWCRMVRHIRIFLYFFVDYWSEILTKNPTGALTLSQACVSLPLEQWQGARSIDILKWLSTIVQTLHTDRITEGKRTELLGTAPKWKVFLILVVPHVFHNRFVQRIIKTNIQILRTGHLWLFVQWPTP